MINRLIKNEKDYKNALSRIDQLMDAEAGTPEVDELELLTTLVEMYEDQHYPIGPPDPIDAIKFRMEQLGLIQKDLVPIIGSKSKVSEVMNRKRPLTLAMMRALHKGLRISAEVLMREPGASFPNEIPDMDWTRFPVVEMAKRCWIPKHSDQKDKAEELVWEFINQAGGLEIIPAAIFRKSVSSRINKKADPYALMAWCLRIFILARENPIKSKYVRRSVNLKFIREIAKLSFFDHGPRLAKEYLEKNGIHLIIVPHLPRTYLDGATMLLPSGKPVIGMTLRYDRLDNFWFCLLHELAHVAKHLTSPDTIIIDDLDFRRHEKKTGDRIEKDADEMAMEAMIPRKVWSKRPVRGRATPGKVVELAETLKIHPAIIAGRIRFENQNYRLLSRLVGNGEVRKHFPETCAI
jgi:HTH-type transcriptional regulator/antitoxin HigA